MEFGVSSMSFYYTAYDIQGVAMNKDTSKAEEIFVSATYLD